MKHRFYKYKSLEGEGFSYLVDYFQQRVFFPSYGSLNDPFERSAHIEQYRPKFILDNEELFDSLAKALKVTREDLRKSLESRGFEYSEETLDKCSEQARSKFSKNGVLCLSSNNNYILMWSHYADNHKGCCLEFEIDFSHGITTEEFKNKDNELKKYVVEVLNGSEIFLFFNEQDKKNVIKFAFSKVNYSSKYPSISLESCCEIRKQSEYEEIKYLMENVFSVKYKDWQYENEFRLVLNGNGLVDLRNYPFIKIIGVILGSEITESNRRKICELCEKFDIKNIYKADRASREYRIIINKIDR